MVDIATLTVEPRTPTAKTHHADEETFRVAEELMLLSASRSKGAAAFGTGPSNGGGRMNHEHVSKAAESAQLLRKRQKALSAQFDMLKSPHAPQKRTRPMEDIDENIINSRCDVSHSQLLKEHRSRFVRVRRRWTMERADRHKALLDGFHVQGIPLVQHLANLTGRR